MNFFIEYNWTVGAWKFRINDSFTDFQGTRSWETLEEARTFFAAHSFALHKSDSRTYRLCRVPAASKTA